VCGSLSVSVSGKRKVLSSRDMADAFRAGGWAALIAAFTAIPLPGEETVLHPQGRSRAEDGAAGKIWSEAAARRPAFLPAGEIFPAAPLQTGSRAAFLPTGLRQIAAWEGRLRGSFFGGHQAHCRRADSCSSFRGGTA
jgi:hypothetical protein